MATKFNLPLAVAVIAIAVVAYSAVDSMQGFAIVGSHPSAFCNDADGLDIHVQTNCSDATGTYVEACHPAGGVVEYYCAPNNLCSARKIRCGYKEACIDGACTLV